MLTRDHIFFEKCTKIILFYIYIRFFIIFVIVKITWSENGVIMKAFPDSFENSEKKISWDI